MKTKWNLSTIYECQNSDDYKTDIESLKNNTLNIRNKISCFIEEIENNKQLDKDFSDILARFEETHLLSSKLITYNVMKQSIDSNDTKASGALEEIKSILSDSTSSYVGFFKVLEKINYHKIAEVSDFVKEHLSFLDKKADSVKHLLTEKEEALLSKVNNVTSDSWVRLHGSLISNEFIDFEINDKKASYSISMLRTLISNSSKELRKRAYEKELELSKRVSLPVSECINSLKGNSLVISKSRGFSSPLDEVLFNSQMKKETLDSLLTAVKKYLPELQEYFKIKSRALKNSGALPYYDLFAPLEIRNKEYDFEEAKKIVIENFYSFSDEFGQMAEQAFENSWVDAFPGPGKRGGAFCMNLSYKNESRVLLNFNNSFKSIITMAHELGHAYHNYCSTDIRPICLGSPVPLAETASIFAENIVKRNILKKCDDVQKLLIIEADLCDMGQKVIDIYSRYLFESNVFEERKKGILSSEQLCDIMRKSQIQAYGNGLDHNSLHPYMWVNKPHYYGSDFYNFPYAFGILFSRGLYKMYLDEGSSFAQKYNKFLANTNLKTVEESAASIGIDVTTPEFWETSVKEYVKDVGLFKKYVNETV
jgi:pepF/M3 family oligoendopeptidase